MRDDRLYLVDIVDAANAIDGFLTGMSREEFYASELHRSGTLQKLMVIGEAAARLTSELRDQHPEVPWRDIVAFRNIAVHAYFSVDWAIVWIAATKNAPELQAMIQEVLRFEFPND